MRVLHFFKTYYPDSYGGIEQFIRQLIEGGRKLGVEAEVLTLSAGEAGDIRVDNHRVRRVKRLFRAASTDVSLAALAEFKKMAKAADFIHYHFPWPMADLAHIFAAHRKPCLVTYHSDIVAQKRLLPFYRPLMKHFLGRMGAIVAGSPNYIQSSPVLGHFSGLLRCIPFGLEELGPPEAERVEYWRRRLGERFFLFIGGLRYYKGLTFLLEAAKGLACPIALVGGGELESELKALVAQKKLSNVHFLGPLPQDDKIALLAACYAFVFPSHLRSEAFGLAQVEAAMFAKPLISCEMGSGVTYVNQNGQTGLIVPPADPPAIREALLKLWENPTLAARLGAGARQRYEEFFTREKMAAAYCELYRELLG